MPPSEDDMRRAAQHFEHLPRKAGGESVSEQLVGLFKGHVAVCFIGGAFTHECVVVSHLHGVFPLDHCAPVGLDLNETDFCPKHKNRNKAPRNTKISAETASFGRNVLSRPKQYVVLHQIFGQNLC